MKYTFIVSLIAITVFGCAKKITPAATPAAPQPPAAVVPAPDAAKMDSSMAVLSPEKMAALGHDTYTAKCGRCHGLKKVDNYTATEWVPILADMAVKAKLDNTEKANVLAYVQANAKK